MKKNKWIANHRLGGRIEFICEHGVGHYPQWYKDGDGIHGCDGCCRDPSFPGRLPEPEDVAERIKECQEN